MAYRKHRGKAPCILGLDTKMEVSGQLHVLATLLLGREFLVSTDSRLGGPKRCSGCGGKLLLGIELKPVASHFTG
jgi:hypothetical protein